MALPGSQHISIWIDVPFVSRFGDYPEHLIIAAQAVVDRALGRSNREVCIRFVRRWTYRVREQTRALRSRT
jgi:hypothetical protein